jgi:hypothetical protein
MKLMNLLLESLNEAEVSDDAIEKAVAKLVKVDPSKVDLDKAEKGESAEQSELNEVAIAITIAGLIPAALELLGGAANWFKKHFGDDKSPSAVGEKLKKAGHQLHKAYTYPIERMLAGVAYFQKKGSKLKDPKYRQKVANILYAATMLSIAGAGIAEHITKLDGVAPVVKTMADGAKAGLSISQIAGEAIEQLV